MKPDGWPQHHYRDEDFAPTSKHAKLRSPSRKSLRRKLKKMGRRIGKEQSRLESWYAA